MSTLIPLKATGSYESFPDGYYPARCTKVQLDDEKPDIFNPGKFKREIRWSWALTIPGRDDEPSFTTWTSQSLHEKSWLPKLMNAINLQPTENGSLRVEDAIGKSCRLNLSEVEYTDATGALGYKNKLMGYSTLVAKPRPARPGTPARPAAPPPQEDEDGEVGF